ncbi:Bug family tripartite tricarboxylate transporter substrate binding protein [Roseomonas marmotae]|uniref:Tripartite tricarboxylate transporter substrate binding protein n=1 Tax=Roseomonas marmotae TaxID=2768161 RepID=A0ABS3KC53_9PROT|nr:tripartite tricarboxylate transporter substrate binding protein [Roseomonas marmotae]MBO1075053.1 tripartite tricarboxylate transporter substrate binding protein [Roseomonas marmotae]QTI79915.1 tripartite tricarboxylate transporter substrate binding protein [Roseomonas marmotae]
MTTRRRLLQAAALAAPALGLGTARAQTGGRAIRFVVPFAAGGGSDVVARLFTEDLSRALGAPVVIDNRPGMAGSLGADSVAKSPPDGTSIVICTPGVQMTNPFLYPALPYDAEKDFTPIIHLAELPNLLVVHPSVPARSTAELIAYLKKNPGKVNFASSGPGSSSHLAAELFKSMAQVEITHVPYRGSGPALIDLVAGRVQMAVDSFSAMMPVARAGQLRALGISTEARRPEAPDVPAIAEALPGYEASTLLYIAGPAGMPAPVVQRLNAAFNEALKIQRIRDRFRELGMVPTGGRPEELQDIIVTQTRKWKRVIEISGARVE